MDNKKNDEDESGFLEAPFVRMLRMRSASLKNGNFKTRDFSPLIHVKRGQNVATKFCQKILYCDSTLKMQTEFFKKSLIIQIRKSRRLCLLGPSMRGYSFLSALFF